MSIDRNYIFDFLIRGFGLTVSCNGPIIRLLMRSNLSPHFKIR